MFPSLPMGTMGMGASAPATGAASSAPSWLQQLLSGGALNQAPLNSAPFEKQLMTAGGYTNAPQAPAFQPHPGMNPALQGILSGMPPRPTGLPPGMLGYAPGVIDQRRPDAAPAAPAALPPGLLTAIRQAQFDRSGRRGDLGGRGGSWGGPADHADRADHMGGGHTDGNDKDAAGRDAARN
jgi:hypothetical protein